MVSHMSGVNRIKAVKRAVIEANSDEDVKTFSRPKRMLAATKRVLLGVVRIGLIAIAVLFVLCAIGFLSENKVGYAISSTAIGAICIYVLAFLSDRYGKKTKNKEQRN